MSITINCAIDLTEEELLFILRRRADHAVIDQVLDAATAAVMNGNETPPSVSIPEERIEAVETVIAAALGGRIDEDYPVTEGIPPPRLPKAPRRAKTNGAEAPVNSTPLAPPPPPEPLDEPAMRSLLSRVGAVHPLKVKAITDLLEAHGGKRRLSECDPSTWPAIAEAALVALKEHSA